MEARKLVRKLFRQSKWQMIVTQTRVLTMEMVKNDWILNAF